MMKESVDQDLKSTDWTSVDQILNNITQKRKEADEDSSDAREKLLGLAKDLVSVLESPIESVRWMIWAEPTRTVATRVALDLKLFDTLVEDNGRPKTTAELAAPTNASPILVHRIARKLSSMRMINETAPAKYEPNAITHVLTNPVYYEGFRLCCDLAGTPFGKLPEYLEQTKFQNPSSPSDGNFQFATKSAGIFPWLQARPRIMQGFMAHLHGQHKERPTWTDDGFYPVHKNLIDGLELEGDSSALVDVAGGAGHQLDQFRVEIPEWKGRLVLQEVPKVIDLAKSVGTNERIELQVHDFFKAQPVKGARAYYLRYILHDWTDDQCRQILGHLKDVMTPGYSKILVNECVLADMDAAWWHVSLDLYMMALTATAERTETEWRTLIESAGLRVTGIWNKGIGNESLIEIMV